MTGRFVQATLVVPTSPNQGSMSVAGYDYALGQLELELIATFGGFTAVDGRGAWENGPQVLHEQVRVYTLAAENGMTAVGLAALRERVKNLLDQRAVYLAAYDLAEKPVQ